MTLDARIAIEALRAGVPNRAAVRLMGTEEPGLEQQFDEQLHHAWAEKPRPGLGIAGGFGSGKSHFLGYLAEVAPDPFCEGAITEGVFTKIAQKLFGGGLIFEPDGGAVVLVLPAAL